MGLTYSSVVGARPDDVFDWHTVCDGQAVPGRLTGAGQSGSAAATNQGAVPSGRI